MGAIRVAYSGTYLGTTWAVIHWFFSAFTSDPTDADVDSLNTALAGAFASHLLGPISSTTTHFTTTSTTVYLGVSGVIRRIRVADATGAQGGGDLPAQVSILVDWASRDGRRGGKPRSYMPGVAHDVVLESYQVASGSLAGMNTAVAAYIAAVNALTEGTIPTLEFVDMSFVNGGAYRATPVFFPITGGHVRPVLATQRRRVDRQA